MEPHFLESFHHLQDILKKRATSETGSLIYYPPGNTSASNKFSYHELYAKASRYGEALRTIPNFEEGNPVLLHLDEAWDTIIWFWAILLANGLPVLSSPFSAVADHRHEHIQGLSKLLQNPICITKNRLLNQFDGHETQLRMYTIESIDSQHLGRSHLHRYSLVQDLQTGSRKYKGDQALAMLMLTSGSTGNAKAVRLSHRQVIAAVSGKASVRTLPGKGCFLNWIGLDHVASLVEIHIQALWLGFDQVHVNAADVVSNPTVFMDLLSRHRVCRTFAPNFFLGRLLSTIKPKTSSNPDEASWDLSSLRIVASGGEANDVNTCVAASSLFYRCGARPNVITPGFGMTETCAGAVFNLTCPDYDARCRYTVASLGKCMTGIDMRVVVGARLASTNEPGDLEVRGDVVFDGYYHNPEATADAFPLGAGWFRTGDQAFLDSGGNLCLIGRKKEVININGIKVIIADIDSLLDRALGNLIDRFVLFPSRGAHTEQITIGYVPRMLPHLAEDMAKIEMLATEACLSSVSAPPLVFSLRQSSFPLLPASSLGKISRAKMSSLFEEGVFDEDVALHRQSLHTYRKEKASSSSTASADECLLLEDFAKILHIDLATLGPDTQVFELGVTSMDLIRLKRHIDRRLGITVPIITLMKNPTARLLAAALKSQCCSLDSPGEQQTFVATYDPVVTLKPSGIKTPLWLVHPGVGEVLVFVGLAQHLGKEDRPIYALRARGFEAGQSRFSSITEAVDTYVRAIQRQQPQGPYALAGYSYGAMLAFEIAKRLGGSVRFLGSFNLPPHIKSRMRQLYWNMCLLHLTQFLGLTTETDLDALEQKPGFSAAPRSDALAEILRVVDRARMEELGLEDMALARWADVAYGLQSMAVEYEPNGQVDGIDVFHAIPLKQAAASREEWVSKQLSKWHAFSRTEPRMHAVGGAHYTIIGPEHVVGFAMELNEALRGRGI